MTNSCEAVHYADDGRAARSVYIDGVLTKNVSWVDLVTMRYSVNVLDDAGQKIFDRAEGFPVKETKTATAQIYLETKRNPARWWSSDGKSLMKKRGAQQ